MSREKDMNKVDYEYVVSERTTNINQNKVTTLSLDPEVKFKPLRV